MRSDPSYVRGPPSVWKATRVTPSFRQTALKVGFALRYPQTFVDWQEEPLDICSDEFICALSFKE
jgi:hypothetical protein